jgi:hypothetical protein
MSASLVTIDQIPDAYRALPVRFVRVVCHTMGPVVQGGQLSQNHWSIYLVTQGGSVRLNMTLKDPHSKDNTGALQVSLLTYEITNSATAYWDFQPRANAAVWEFTNNIITKQRQRYIMAEHGVGCRFWMYDAECFSFNQLLTSSAILSFLTGRLRVSLGLDRPRMLKLGQ